MIIEYSFPHYFMIQCFLIRNKLKNCVGEPMELRVENREINPTRFIVIGFSVVIFIGSILLTLPISTAERVSTSYVDALFTATSAIAVTGLVVMDTGTYWSAFGQIVIISLIQIGGLGFMTMVTMFAMAAGKRISLKERILLQTSLNQTNLSGIVRLTKYIFIGTLIIESIGAFFISIRFIPIYGWSRGIGYSIFHSISAFCNAGFDLIGDGRSLTPFVGDPVINFTISLLIILGGLGFTVLLDLGLNFRNRKKWAFHTKLVLVISGLLLAIGFILFLILEWGNPNTLGQIPIYQRPFAAFFQSVTTRTAGFNTIDTAGLTDASKFLTIILMFIGGSPASTAGGIKTVTFGIILFTIVSEIQGKRDTEVFKRRIPRQIINRALTIMLVALGLVVVVTMLLTITENNLSFMEIIFETTSAFGTVGLSVGATSSLSPFGRILITLLMFAGRVGPFTLALALMQKHHKDKGKISYPEEKVIIG